MRLLSFAGLIAIALAMLSVHVVAQSSAVVPTKTNPTFTFHTNEFWLNLHHFLYVLGRATNKERDITREAVASAPADAEQGIAKLTPADQALWRTAVASYAAGLSKKDAVFDEAMPRILVQLSKAGAGPTLSGTDLDPTVRLILEKVAPIYRKRWWPKHKAQNEAWKEAMEKLVSVHGAKVREFVTQSYRQEWPGFHVHASAYANWAGAYSTIYGNMLVVSSTSLGVQGDYGLETIFHEGMHQWDDQMDAALIAAGKRANKSVPRGLEHAMIFFTAGEAVRSAIPSHGPYAEKFGVWSRGLDVHKPALEAVWAPYLKGKGDLDNTLTELLKQVGK